ncbi:MAG: trigger factor [Deltaproteobacteria bacterium]|nr:trigger factor [Deltaproteobacteria bacterium]MBW2105626.1 trigger factor [Deltaproteobacteria bacterium]
METSIEEISQVKRQINVEIETEEVAKKLDQAYNKLSKRAKVKGFRPGKAPRRILEQYYGKEIMTDVKNDLIKESFSKVIEETKLFPLGNPSIEAEAIQPGKNFNYTILMEIRPDFELKEYMGIPVEKEILNISEDNVDKKLKELREAHAQLVSINEERGIKEGDYVIINYDCTWKDEHVKGIEGKDFMIHIGDKNFYPEIESGIRGLKKAEKKDIKIDFSEDFSDRRLANKSVTFHISVEDIKKKDLPDLNDDFARSLGKEFKSLADLRERVKKEITLQEEKRIDSELKKRLLKKITAKVDFELPQTMVENEIEHSMATIKQNFLRAGTKLESANISEDTMRQDLKLAAEEKVKEGLILSKIADLEGIKLEDSDIRDGFQELAAQTGQNLAILQQYYEKNNLMDSFRNQILMEKILNHLVQGAKISEVQEISEESQKDRKVLK